MQKNRQPSKAKKQQKNTSQPKLLWLWLVVGAGLIAVIAFAFFRLAPYTSTEISVNDAQAKLGKGTFFLDVRTQTEWDEAHIANNVLIPLDQLPTRLAEVPKDQDVVIICRSGRRATEAAALLRNAGYTRVFPMTGGLIAWKAAGYPVDESGL